MDNSVPNRNGKFISEGKRKMVIDKNNSLFSRGGKISMGFTKGKMSMVKTEEVGNCHSGSYSVCYGDQSEETDIRRNNGR